MISEKLEYKVNLKQDALVQALNAYFVQGDVNAHTITMTVMDGDEPANLSGVTCAGGVVRNDKSVVGLTGTISGNVATVTIPAAAYNITGRLVIIVKLNDGTVNRTALMLTAMVSAGDVGEIVESTTTLESVSAVLAEAQRVLDSIPADYTALQGEVSQIKENISQLQYKGPTAKVEGKKCYINSRNEFTLDSESESVLFEVVEGVLYKFHISVTHDRNKVGFSETKPTQNGTLLSNVEGTVNDEFVAPITGWCVLYLNSVRKDDIAQNTEVFYTSYWTALSDQVAKNNADISQLDMRLVGFENEISDDITGYPLRNNTIIKGQYVSRDDGTFKDYATYNRTDYIKIDTDIVNSIAFTKTPDVSWDIFYNAWYDENKNFIKNFDVPNNKTTVIVPPTNARYFVCSFKNEITLSYAFNYNKISESIVLKLTSDKLKHNTDGYLWRFNDGKTPVLYSVSYVSARIEKTLLPKGTRIMSGVNSQFKLFEHDLNGNPLYDSDTQWIRGAESYTIKQDCYAYINVAEYPTNQGSGDIENVLKNFSFIFPITVLNNSIVGNVSTKAEDYESYYVDSALKKHLIMSEFIGNLTYHQSFCIYNGQYISTDGNHIARQDSNFNIIESKDCYVGHGNSLQLANDGKMYASGWDDDKVYVVDPVTLSVEKTINLPTSGYTTVAVDTDNGLMYIFQRTTYPNTEDYYNLIVYDYVGNSTISTKRIHKFSFMQSVDFYKDRIFVTSGDGSNNRFNVYDTCGNIVCDYYLPQIRTEPEGVYIDKNTMDIYISDVSKKLFLFK